MAGYPPHRPHDPVAEELEQRLRMAGSITKRLAPLVVGAVLILWLASGIYTVGPGEIGVVRHFGKEISRSPSGLHYRIPWPVQQVDIVDVQNIRRAEIGFRTQGGQVARVNSEALMLTGDENIVDAQLIVQYRVSDPGAYLFRVRSADEVLRSATEVALRNAVGNMKIDDILTVGRAQTQEDTRAFLQTKLDEYQSGLQVTAVQLQVVDPPEQVKDAFHEVVRAREDRERLINESLAYQEDILPKARGQAQENIRGAEAYREQRVIQAQGDAAKFEAILEEYSKSKEVTRDRLHLEVLERVLSRVDKIVMDGSSGSNMLPFLPLRGMPETPVRSQTQTGQSSPAPQAQPAAQNPLVPQAQQPAAQPRR
jgi:modulator of FtsH protease HflK